LQLPGDIIFIGIHLFPISTTFLETSVREAKCKIEIHSARV
jgi:hypothetical protein